MAKIISQAAGGAQVVEVGMVAVPAALAVYSEASSFLTRAYVLCRAHATSSVSLQPYHAYSAAGGSALY